MPWKEVRPMDQKVLFMADFMRGGRTFAELCRLYGISRKTGYKLVNRYIEDGLEALQERSSKPHSNPQRTPYAVRNEIIKLRKRGRMKPGPKKIHSLLLKEHSEWDIPSRTTIYNILRKEGLVEPRKRRRRVPPGAKPFEPVGEPNDVWTADFKGQFITGDGKWCYPLTVMDLQSRYLLGCRGLDGIATESAKDEFERLFRRYGLPRRIRTDNGVPFASRSVGGISRLSRWWIRLGILPERIEPGKPQQNGAHERMHRTLKAGAILPPGRTSAHQQELFDQFCREYNEERPHESLGQEPPASRYQPSARPMPEQLPELEYPGHYWMIRVSSNGVVYFLGDMLYVGNVLKGEHVGMEEIDDGIWDVYFGPVRLGGFNMRDKVKNKYGYRTLKV